MFDIKTIITSLVVSLLVVMGAGLVGNQSSSLGASGTRFPNGLSTNSNSPSSGQMITTTFSLATTTNSGLSMGTAGATSTVSLGKVCYTVTTSNGSTVFYWYGPSGDVASSTTSCN